MVRKGVQRLTLGRSYLLRGFGPELGARLFFGNLYISMKSATKFGIMIKSLKIHIIIRP